MSNLHLSPSIVVDYLFREQRLLFVLVGVLIGSTFFILQPTLSRLGPSEARTAVTSSLSGSSPVVQSSNRGSSGIFQRRSVSGRVPADLDRRRFRIVITGGVGFGFEFRKGRPGFEERRKKRGGRRKSRRGDKVWWRKEEERRR
ncbi:unnamed protein product [Linum trigynum]|uniref:Transmembrane protein n=1 Tax=Linum trigynum TaxID=586398 RepID=A0AAV2FTM8_9ROSI